MMRWVGVMSGTSLDGVDVAVVETEGRGERPRGWRLTAFRTEPYETAVRSRIAAAITSGSSAAICALDFELGARIGAAVLRALAAASLEPGDIEAIGSHGQTVWHTPPVGTRMGATLQLGQPAVIAERTGCDVVSDFRVRDMAAGGEGAPLTAYTDWILLRGRESRAIQNIGGIGNVTALPGHRSGGTPQAYDTGPGVVLIDGAVEVLTGGEARFDLDGAMAARGRVREEALAEWLADPFLDQPPPRSTGREHFSRERLHAWLDRHAGLSAEDAVATLTELTARTITDAYRWLEEVPAACYLCGGGARNPVLAARIGALLTPVPVRDLSALGLDPDAREAVAFALLARQRVLGFAANAPWATGAAGPRLLGVRTPA